MWVHCDRKRKKKIFLEEITSQPISILSIGMLPMGAGLCRQAQD